MPWQTLLSEWIGLDTSLVLVRILGFLPPHNPSSRPVVQNRISDTKAGRRVKPLRSNQYPRRRHARFPIRGGWSQGHGLGTKDRLRLSLDLFSG